MLSHFTNCVEMFHGFCAFKIQDIKRITEKAVMDSIKLLASEKNLTILGNNFERYRLRHSSWWHRQRFISWHSLFDRVSRSRDDVSQHRLISDIRQRCRLAAAVVVSGHGCLCFQHNESQESRIRKLAYISLCNPFCVTSASDN